MSPYTQSASVVVCNMTPIDTLQSTEALMTNDHSLPATTSHLPGDVRTFTTSAESRSGDCTEVVPHGHVALEPRCPEILSNPFSSVTSLPTSNRELYNQIRAWLDANFPPTNSDIDLIINLLASDLVHHCHVIR